MLLKTLVGTVLIGGGFLFGSLSPAAAAITINITSGAGVVNVETSGTFNLDALVNYVDQVSISSSYLSPGDGGVATGIGIGDLYGTTIYDLTPYGADGLASGSGFGSAFAILPAAGGSPAAVVVPAGYVSEHWISSSATIPGSIASLGLTPGEYLTTFSFQGVSDTVVVNVAAVPEPALTALAVVGAVAGLAVIRRRSRRKSLF